MTHRSWRKRAQTIFKDSPWYKEENCYMYGVEDFQKKLIKSLKYFMVSSNVKKFQDEKNVYVKLDDIVKDFSLLVKNLLADEIKLKK